MIKIYKANTSISINVVLPSKKNLHITFTPLSNGNSTFTTDNPDIMKAIESHYNFGKLFKLQSVQGETKPVEKEKKADDAETENPETENPETENPETENSEEVEGKKKVKVSDLAAAKDYLADTFGISRTVLRSMKSIMEQAEANVIEFEGL